MKSKNTNTMLETNILLVLLAAVISSVIAPNFTKAKSLYVIADILGATENRTQPVQAYDIGVDGTLTFQAQHDIPLRAIGAVGMAIDTDLGFVFITYEASDVIQLLNPVTMTDAGTTTAPDASDLAGIVYDHNKNLLYCVDRRTNNLYVYNWFPGTATLTQVPDSPFMLQNAHAYGIAVDEIDGLLYVANASNTVTVYSTSDWRLVDSITLSRIAISIAIDVKNGFIYTGGGYAGNMFLTQYHLATGTEKEVQVEPDAGVMGLGVDADTGLIYISTGRNNIPGGDNLLVYDKALNQIDIITAIGNPTGLAIPSKDIGYNPLNLRKQVLRGADAGTDIDDMKTVEPGVTYTYGVSFENNNDFSVTDVTIVDVLPDEVAFVIATDEGVNGHFDIDEKTGQQTFTWTYEELPPKTSTLLEITVQANLDIDVGKIIRNWATINTNETPPTTKKADVMPRSNSLNLKKRILGVPEGQIALVNSNDIITYIIEFDNKDNDFAATDVSIVDELPENVTFISAINGKGIGRYDDKAHTYTWVFASLQPGELVHLELVVSVNPNLAEGTTITNIVTIDSNETLPATANFDIWVKNIRLEVDNLEISTDTISYNDNVMDITFILELPEGIEIDDVIDEPLILYPAYIESSDQQITEADGRVKVTAVFDKYELLGVMPDYYGPLDLTVEGILTSGQTFFGETTINIIQDEEVWDYVYIEIYMEHNWDYNDPADNSDLTFEFRLRIEVYGVDSSYEDNVDALEFLTPAGKTFQITKQPGQWSDGIWTSYEYDTEWDWATWQYRAKYANLTDLQEYGDGEYTITIHYNDDSTDTATVWFGIPGTADPIPQPTQEPIFTLPLHNQTAESPVTFTWEPCTDTNALEVGIEMQELEHGDFKEEYFDINETNWGPVILTDGSWQAELIFGQWVMQVPEFNNNVSFIASKSSRSRYNFTVVGYPRNTYEVWGGNTWIYWEDGSYRRIADLEENGYKKLGESDGRTASFSGEYSYYLIATRGQFLLDSIQGSDGSYYSSLEASCSSGNMSNEDYLLGPTDGQQAIVGGGSVWYQDDFCGYIAFTNPGNWTGLTVFVGETSPLEVDNLLIIPNVLKRNGTSPYITAVIQFPEGIQQSDIDQNDIPSLYYQDQNTGAYIFIGNGSRPDLSGTEISTSFDRAELMDAVDGYGEFTLRVEGKLKTGQPYYGEYIIYITRFTGD